MKGRRIECGFPAPPARERAPHACSNVVGTSPRCERNSAAGAWTRSGPGPPPSGRSSRMSRWRRGIGPPPRNWTEKNVILRTRPRRHCVRRRDILERMEMNRSKGMLERILAPVSRCLTPEAARQLVEARADSTAQGRIDELADKCTEGALTPAERAEYEAYVAAGTVIAILQAHARQVLASNPAA